MKRPNALGIGVYNKSLSRKAYQMSGSSPSSGIRVNLKTHSYFIEFDDYCTKYALSLLKVHIVIRVSEEMNRNEKV